MTSLRLAIFILCLSTQCVLASSTNIKVFGHDLEIYSKTQGDDEQLTIDKKPFLKEQYIEIKEIGALENTGLQSVAQVRVEMPVRARYSY